MISPVTNRVPYASSIISTCKDNVLDFSKFIYSHNFILILNEHVYSVKGIDGIDLDYLNNPVEEGGNEWPIFTRNYNYSSFIKISLRRAMPVRKSQISSSVIRARLAAVAKMCGGVAQNIARRAALLAAAALDPIATLENGPAIGIIQVFDKTFTKDVANFKFFSYGAERWSSSGLDGTSGEIVIETIDLVCSNLTRMTSDWSKGPSGVWNRDSDGSMYDEKEMTDLEKFRSAIHEKQKAIKDLYKQENSFTDKQIEDLEKKHDKLIDQLKDLTGEKEENEETDREEEKKMKEKSVEETKKELDRLKRLKKWKDAQKN